MKGQMSFRWMYAQPDEETVSRLREQLGVNDTIGKLLALRGIDNYDVAKSFFRASLSALHDPFLMKDMDKAAVRLASAVREQETVVIYGDYDVDGTTATAVMYAFLKEFGLNVHFYIPHRFKEGYGINREGIDFANEKNAGLIVSVDCGITAIEEAGYAREMGIDLIICDHHNAGEILPDAIAVLDPKRLDCRYPFKGLSGAGVGFKLIQAVLTKLGLSETVAYKYLDLVAISIASDIVPINGENRILMREGLRLIRTQPRPGIKALIELIRLNPKTITTTQIVFSIGPRINAAGRMGDAGAAVELMIAGNMDDAARGAKGLEAINIRRRKTDTQTMEEATAFLDEHFNEEEMSTLILHDPEWHLGVIGIVASRLVERYGRPTIMLSTVDGQVKGSARSIRGFNIYNALKECEDLLVKFGGHEYAAGLTIEEEHLEAFRERFNGIAGELLSREDFERELTIDTELDFKDIDTGFWKIMKQFEPYGPSNMAPLFVTKGLNLVGKATVVGKGHLKMRLAQNGSGPFDAIAFNMHEYLPVLNAPHNGELTMAYALEENTWRNQTELQIRIKDIRIGD
ncbi:MAG: single-stranded-DNA-specific exonuclease RecJ [Balneolales bacterium]